MSAKALPRGGASRKEATLKHVPLTGGVIEQHDPPALTADPGIAQLRHEEGLSVGTECRGFTGGREELEGELSCYYDLVGGAERLVKRLSGMRMEEETHGDGLDGGDLREGRFDEVEKNRPCLVVVHRRSEMGRQRIEHDEFDLRVPDKS